jgi:hypothetical protein
MHVEKLYFTSLQWAMFSFSTNTHTNIFCKIRWHNNVQSSTDLVYSPFVSVYIKPVINKGCMGSIIWVSSN